VPLPENEAKIELTREARKRKNKIDGFII